MVKRARVGRPVMDAKHARVKRNCRDRSILRFLQPLASVQYYPKRGGRLLDFSAGFETGVLSSASSAAGAPSTFLTNAGASTTPDEGLLQKDTTPDGSVTADDGGDAVADAAAETPAETTQTEVFAEESPAQKVLAGTSSPVLSLAGTTLPTPVLSRRRSRPRHIADYLTNDDVCFCIDRMILRLSNSRLQKEQYAYLVILLARLRIRDEKLLLKVLQRSAVVWALLRPKLLIQAANAVAELDMGGQVGRSGDVTFCVLSTRNRSLHFFCGNALRNDSHLACIDVVRSAQIEREQI